MAEPGVPARHAVTELPATRLVADQLAFPEAPRWHDGKLWFADMLDGAVLCARDGGDVERVAEVPGQPSGLGWLPDGRLLVVSMRDRRLLYAGPEGLGEVADLSALAPCHCNDMVVDGVGRAYVGNFGFDLPGRTAPAPTGLVLVAPGEPPRIVADGLLFPNGCVVTPDGATLIVAETFGARLTAFSIAADGSLYGRQTWAALPGRAPDGICLDAEGAVWVASPPTREVVRVVRGGAVTHRVATAAQAIACTLGGTERRELFVVSGHVSFDAAKARSRRSGRIESLSAPFAGAGWP